MYHQVCNVLSCRMEFCAECTSHHHHHPLGMSRIVISNSRCYTISQATLEYKNTLGKVKGQYWL